MKENKIVEEFAVDLSNDFSEKTIDFVLKSSNALAVMNMFNTLYSRAFEEVFNDNFPTAKKWDELKDNEFVQRINILLASQKNDFQFLFSNYEAIKGVDYEMIRGLTLRAIVLADLEVLDVLNLSQDLIEDSLVDIVVFEKKLPVWSHEYAEDRAKWLVSNIQNSNIKDMFNVFYDKQSFETIFNVSPEERLNKEVSLLVWRYLMADEVKIVVSNMEDQFQVVGSTSHMSWAQKVFWLDHKVNNPTTPHYDFDVVFNMMELEKQIDKKAFILASYVARISNSDRYPQSLKENLFERIDSKVCVSFHSSEYQQFLPLLNTLGRKMFEEKGNGNLFDFYFSKAKQQQNLKIMVQNELANSLGNLPSNKSGIPPRF